MLYKKILHQQFGAAIDMLENAIRQCPDELWNTETKFWYISYHTLFWLDYYLSDEPRQFAPPSPFTLSEFDPSGLLPNRVYSKTELLEYLEHGRQKCYRLVSDSTIEQAEQAFDSAYKNYPILEMLLYNMRHVQHHAAQLNLLLRQGMDDAPRWVSRANVK